MKPIDELDELLRKLSDGDLSPADAIRLNDRLRGDPEACERYLNQATLEASLDREFGGAAQVDFEGAFAGPPGLGVRQSSGAFTALHAQENQTEELGHGNSSAIVPLPVIPGSDAGSKAPERSVQEAGKRRRTAALQNAGETTLTPWFRYSLAACLAIAVTLFAVKLGKRPAETVLAPAPSTQLYVATLVFAENCEWASSAQFAEGQPLPAGALSLRRGTAVVRFHGGAEAVLTGEVELELESPGSARLRHGDVVIRAEDGAAGFTLHTPTSELTDLGTEFAVKVARDGATELHVLEGEVAYAPNVKAAGAVLDAGQAVRFDRANDAPHPVALNASRFAELVKQANPRERPDLMTVYEGFHYDAGRYAPEEITKGKGWAGPWRLRRGEERQHPDDAEATTDMQIVHGKLNVPWPVEGGRLGMLEAPAGQFFRVRPMAAPIALDHDGITYFSLMTQEPNHASRRPGARPLEGVRLTFRSSADYWGENLSFGWSHRLQPQIQAGADGTFVSPARIPDEQSLLWVGKILRRADGEDEVSLRIYGQEDMLDFAEPATWHVVSRGLRQDAALDLVVLSSTGTSPRIVDELRVGPTWRSVVPIRNPTIAVK